MKKIPKRTCISCNSKYEKIELIRIVINKQKQINVDETFKMEGRGAYLCKNIECLEKLIKIKKLEKTFETKIENEIYEKIRGVILDN
jgi:predicted RNA-binding protein YlxR (DUF448 family)